MRGISDALRQRLRRADPTARIMIEGRIETAAEIKQRYDQWGEADSLAGLERLADGGVRLLPSDANGPVSTIVTSSSTYYRSRQDSGYTNPNPKIDPLIPDTGEVYFATLVDWAGNESNEAEIGEIQAWLHPQYDLTINKIVANWECQVFAVTAFLTDPTSGVTPDFWALREIGRATKEASGQAAGFVSFSFADNRLKPKLTAALYGEELRRYMVLLFHGFDKDGAPASNIGLGYDSGHASVVSAAGSIMSGRKIVSTSQFWDGVQWRSTPSVVQWQSGSAGATGTVPAVKVILSTYTAATITFSDGTPDVNLGISTPKAQIELVGRGQTPSGTSLAYEVQDDAAVWRAFTDGQTLDEITGFTSANYTTLKMRSTLTPNTAGDATPILRGLGVRAVTTTNLSDVAEVNSVSWAFDPLDHHAEIPELRLSAIHDGERDFRDAISRFLSEQSIGTILLRLYCGDTSLEKSDWMHLDDFLIDDYDLAADRAYITGVSPLALVRGALPKLTDQGTAYPDSTVSNPGSWTEVGGATNLYAALADNEGGIGLVPWDDSTAIQSVVNPSSAEITVGLQDISQPTTPIVGQVIVQFRYKLVSGTSLTLACALMQGATQKSSVSVTVSSTNVVQGTLTPTVTELSSISDWTDLRLRFTANGTGQLQVTWARLVVLPVRLPLTYSLASPATIVQDLLSGQVGLDGRYRGPDLQGVAGVGTGTTITLGKTIASPIGGSTDLTIAKQELDAVSYIAGAVHTSSQGRVVARQLYDVTVGTDGTVTYAPKTRSPTVFIPREELMPTSVRPGFQYRVPEFDVDWGFLESNGNYTGMAHGVSDVALQNLGEARIVPQKHAPEAVSRWVQDQGLANGLSFRQVQNFGMGYMGWRFLSEYAYPELELGDVIGIETDRFLAYDPSAARQIAGGHWVSCIVTGIFDPWGHDIAVWVPSFANIGATSAKPPIVPKRRIDNLIFNGDFENGLAGWALGSLESSSDTIAGSASMVLEGPQGAPTLTYQNVPETKHAAWIPVVAGDVLTLAGTAKAAASTVVASFRVIFSDDTQNFTSPISTVDVVTWTETSATTKSGSVQAPIGATYVNFQLVMDPPANPPAIYRAWFDDLSARFSSIASGMSANLAAANTPQTVHVPTVFNVKDPPYSAKGDGVTDDYAAIVAAQAAATTHQGKLFFPEGMYLCSDYVDIGPGTAWEGTCRPAASGGGTIILATGTNKGIVRWRPGTAGSVNQVSGQANFVTRDIAFSGGASTGHLVNLARITKFRAENCSFNNTAGTGLKDDGSTSIAAAGVYAYGCELLSFADCSFENNTSVSGNGGAGVMLEKSCHMIAAWHCHFNGNTRHWRFVDQDNGVIQVNGGTDFNAGGTCFYSDVGSVYNLTMDNCWAENQTDTTGAIIDFSGANYSQNITITNNKLTAGSVSNSTAFQIGAAADFFSVQSNLIANFKFVYSIGTPYNFANGISRSNLYSGIVTGIFTGTAHQSFAEVDGWGTSVGSPSAPVIDLTDGATVNINAASGRKFRLSAAAGRTIAAPTNLTDGQDLDITIINASGGAMTTTWNTIFKFATAWADPANGKRRVASFSYDGSAGILYEKSHGGDM